MNISREISLEDFEAWSGAVDTMDTLRSLDFEVDFNVFDELEAAIVNDVFGSDTIDETSLNDFLWMENDFIAEILGYNDWEGLVRVSEGKSEEPIENEYVIGEDVNYMGCHYIVSDFDEDTGLYTLEWEDGDRLFIENNIEESELDYWDGD